MTSKRNLFLYSSKPNLCMKIPKCTLLIFLIVILSFALRSIWLHRFPPSLYSDEADQGYNAFSILKTGRDEHGIYMPVSIRSFGDWKPPLPTYIMIPFIFIGGLQEIPVRLPSAILSSLNIYVVFLLAKLFFNNNKNRNKIALLSSFFMAISPWAILQGRVAMLVAVGLFFLTSFIYFFLLGKRNQIYYFLSFFCFSFSIYSYYGLRIVSPLILFFMLFKSRKELFPLTKKFIVSATLGIALLIPLTLGTVKNRDVLIGRARTISIFYDKGIEAKKWELEKQDWQMNNLFKTITHSKIFLYSVDFTQRYFSHFDPKYLFIYGDKTPPFQIPNMGLLYISDGGFLLLGIWFLLQIRTKNKDIILIWLIISIIPAAFTFITPSSNRTYNAIIPLMIIISLGMVWFTKKINRQLTTGIIISLIYSLNLAFFLHQYFYVITYMHSDWWNYGWKDTVSFVGSIEKNYENIYVLDNNGMPYIYFLFYNKLDPKEFQNKSIRNYVEDRYGFDHVDEFNKYIFPQDWEWKYTKENLQRKSLYIVPVEQSVGDVNNIKTVYYLNGQIKSKIFANE